MDRTDSIKAKLTIKSPEELKTCFQDIVGYSLQIEALKSALIDPVKYRNYVQPRSGVCLYGPPGTGKSSMAKAVSTELNYNFVSVKAGDLDSKYHGEGPQNIIACFGVARQLSPCLLFIDEVDQLLSSRENHDSHHNTKLVETFLTELDDSLGSVFLLSTTNYPYKLDAAYLRRIIPLFIPLPDRDVREKLLRGQLQSKSNISDENFMKLSKLTERYSCSDILSLVSLVLSKNIKTMNAADHFIRITKSKYEPCFCSDKSKCGGFAGSIEQFPTVCINIPKVSMENVLNTMRYCRASPVNNSHLIEKFRNNYGDGIQGEDKRNNSLQIQTAGNKCGFCKLKNFLYIIGVILLGAFLWLLWIIG